MRPWTPDLKPSSTLILLGATGDLSQRMLLPLAVRAVSPKACCPQDFRLVSCRRRATSDGDFANSARGAVGKYLPRDRQNASRLAAFLDRLHYHNADLDDPSCFGPVREMLGDAASRDIGVFLPLPPACS